MVEGTRFGPGLADVGEVTDVALIGGSAAEGSRPLERDDGNCAAAIFENEALLEEEFVELVCRRLAEEAISPGAPDGAGAEPPVLLLSTCMTPTRGWRANVLLKFSSRLSSSNLKYFISSIAALRVLSASRQRSSSSRIACKSSGRDSRAS